MSNPFEYLKSIDLVALEIQQAILFLILGTAILLSGGNIVQDTLYGNPSIFNAAVAGVIQFFFGFFYLFSIHFKQYHFCILFSWIAALVWFSFAGFYFANSIHQIGAITCLILGGTNALCCYSCYKKRLV